MGSGPFFGQQIKCGESEVVLAIDAEKLLKSTVQQTISASFILDVHRQRNGLDQFFDEMQLFLKIRRRLMSRRDVGANGYVLVGASGIVDKGHDGGGNPVEATVFCPILDLARPHPAGRNAIPQFTKEFRWMQTRFDNTMIAPFEFGTGIAADFAKLVIGIGYGAVAVGDADYGMLVERELLVLEGNLGGADLLAAFMAVLDEPADDLDQILEIIGLAGRAIEASLFLQ